MRKIAIYFLFLISILNSSAQDSTIFQFATTRGSFGEGCLLVPKGKAQVEIGAQYNYFTTINEIQHPNFLLKYGISNYFEFRISGDATTYKNSTSRITGLHPIYIGMKLKMIDAKKYAPGSSFIGGLSVNIISTKNFRTKYVAPYFKIVMEQFLPKNFGMIYNYGVTWDGETPLPTYSFAITTNYTKILKSKSLKHQQIKPFMEVYGFYPQGKSFDIRADMGFMYLFNKWLQFDFSVGSGFLKASPKFTCNSGFIFRFLKDKKEKN